MLPSHFILTRDVSCSLIVSSPTHIHANYEFAGKYVYVSTRLLSEQHLLYQKFLLAENLNDTEFLGVLSDIVFKLRRFPRHFVHYNRLGGGGSTLADVLSGEANKISPAKGVSICDLDGCLNPPPFNGSTTAGRAFERATALGLIDNQLGLSTSNPFFAFEVTAGYSIENYIGPNLLSRYFDIVNRKREFQPFVKAFPKFPDLNPDEMFIWMCLNLKNGTGPFARVFNAVRDRMGSVPAWVTLRSSLYSELSIPGDVIGWVINNATATRWSSLIEDAILADLKLAIYSEAIFNHAKTLQDVAAGDRQARMT